MRKSIREKLLMVLDTTDTTVWTKRSSEVIGRTDVSSQAIQTITMMLVQLGHNNALNDAFELDSMRLSVIQKYAQFLPLQYQFQAGTSGGCMGPAAVSVAEADFATETVLAALTEHHNLAVNKLTGQLRVDWEQKTLPQLRAAVRSVLESRNAAEF